jgi:4-hydroxyacetophenone monooxygenase
MNKPEGHIRAELLHASDEQIDSAVRFADPMTLRGLLFQLTADPEVARTRVRSAMRGYIPTFEVADEADAELLMRKAAQFLKQYRDAGAGPISSGPPERLARSLGLAFGEDIDTSDLEIYLEELGLDPWARGLKWQAPPNPAWQDTFTVAVIGAGMAGLNMAAQLKNAGIKHTVFEKNAGVGGTWHENRYPGARVDTPSRSYTHIFGVDFGYPNPYCEWHENERYFNWIADNFDLRENIVLQTEVSALTWHEEKALWQVDVKGPDGPQTRFFNAVVTGVGFLNRPSIPENSSKARHGIRRAGLMASTTRANASR